MTNQEGTTQEAEQAQPTQQPELGISDLQNLRSIVEVAVRRGTFGAQEITSVGSVYDRLNAFLIAVMPAQKEEGTDTQSTAA